MSGSEIAAAPGDAFGWKTWTSLKSWTTSRVVGILAILASIALVVAIPLLPSVPVPFGFDFLIAAVPMAVLAFIGRRNPWTSNICTMAFAVLLGLAMTEFFLGWQASAQEAEALRKSVDALKDGGSFTNGYFNTADPDLGYGPVPDKVVDHLRTAGSKPVFHAVYKISPGAFRVTPGNPNASETDVFFGDSFTFGEGLNDDQTLPAQYSKSRDYQTNVVNLGFHGYGPHQMLRALETRRFDKYFTHQVKHVFYQTMGFHIQRVKGLMPWDPDGPRYLIDNKTGAPVFTGKFSDFPSAVFDRRHPILYRSFIVRLVVDALDALPSQADVNLIVGVFTESARMVRKDFNADFTLLVWDFDPRKNDPTGAKIADEAERRGLHVVRISQILKASSPDDFAKRYLIPIDHHPNAEADKVLGTALAKIEH